MVLKCPPKTIKRASYVRKSHSRKSYRRSDGTRVSAARVRKTNVNKSCVPDKGKPGKTPESKKILPKPGDDIHLSKYGYHTDLAEETRHKALRSASRSHGSLVILRRLNLLRNYQADVKSKKIMSKDVEYMSSLHGRLSKRRSNRLSK